MLSQNAEFDKKNTHIIFLVATNIQTPNWWQGLCESWAVPNLDGS